MTTLVLFDEGAPAECSWALRIALAAGQPVMLVGSEEAAGEEDLPEGVERGRLEGKDPIRAVLELAHREDCGLLVFVQQRRGDDRAAERRRRLMRDAPCVFIALFGAEQPEEAEQLEEERQEERGDAHAQEEGQVEGGVLVAVASGPHARTALRVGLDLVRAGVEPVDALYIEPPVGWEAERIGRRILDRHVRHALGDERDRIGRAVVVAEHRAPAVAELARKRGTELVLLGAAKRSAIGLRFGRTVGQRVLRQCTTATVGLCRAPLPLGSRFGRRVEAILQRTVPQLHREERLGLVERVQSSSSWNFDFVALMSLATLIAALGLVQNSSAVIIGAMLVAPLMTPILGLGLALVQGNDHLARRALRTVVLGVVTAFLIGLVTGLVHTAFAGATPEMSARGWPDLTDLAIAFVAGLAAAYASSRPGLVAALPGVAIAAALVPPIATSGLALAVGEYSLAGGAALLFLVNAVAIVLAGAVSLWAVGLRHLSTGSKLARRVGWSSLLLLLALGMLLAF